MSLESPSKIIKAVETLKSGHLVVFPTETVYGLGGDALNPLAVARIFEAKNRPHFNPLIVHLGSKDWISRYVESLPPLAQKLIDHFWPGPLTLVLPKKSCIPDLVTAGLPKVAVRMPSHPVALELLKAFGKPLAAPSANRFTKLSPTTVNHAKEQLGDRASEYLDGGPCRVGVESTVLGFDANGKAVLLREGGISQEDLAPFTGPLQLTKEDKLSSPGQLLHHYAPDIPLYLADREHPPLEPESLGVLSWKEDPSLPQAMKTVLLSKNGDLIEAAANLFQALHTLQASGVKTILAFPPPATGLGRAIRDRLERAQTR